LQDSDGRGEESLADAQDRKLTNPAPDEDLAPAPEVTRPIDRATRHLRLPRARIKALIGCVRVARAGRIGAVLPAPGSNNRRHPEAVAALEQVLELDEAKADALLHLGEAARRDGDSVSAGLDLGCGGAAVCPHCEPPMARQCPSLVEHPAW